MRLSQSLKEYRYPRKPWAKFITPENTKYISREALDLLDRLLRYDHQVFNSANTIAPITK